MDELNAPTVFPSAPGWAKANIDTGAEMVDQLESDVEGPISFGPFRLFAAERVIEKAGTPLQIGDRALDLLVALVARAGEVIDKRELLDRVWPNIIVDEGNLRFHISALRKVLGDGQSGAKYITNVQGRGYAFTAPLSRSNRLKSGVLDKPAQRPPHTLPPCLSRMVGHEKSSSAISRLLVDQRFVTVVGPGGIGKTTVAVSVSHALLPEFGGAIHFVDLGTVSDAGLVAGTLASALGIPVQSDDPTPGIIKFIRDRRMLLVLDSCEHLIEAISILAERIFEEGSELHILATSREPMRVEGEHVFRLPPLDYPAEDSCSTAIEALKFPSVQLFVERAAASVAGFALSNDEAPIVGEVCRKLGGIALAIELAAGRVHTYGIREIAVLLDKRFELLWPGRRTALPRHQTMNATLDWSYNLLPEFEREVLRRLSVFVGVFTLEAAQSTLARDNIAPQQVAEAISAIVAKSLISADTTGTMGYYRLQDTTRTYLYKKMLESGEVDDASRSHATYYCRFLERISALSAEVANPEGIAAYREHVGNVRAALQWSFSDSGDNAIATALAVSSAPLLMTVSPMVECRSWIRRAIAALDDGTRGTTREMELQEALAFSLIITRGSRDDSRAAFTRGLEIADDLGDSLSQLRLMSGLHGVLLMLYADLPSALALAQRNGPSLRESRILRKYARGARCWASPIITWGTRIPRRRILMRV